MNSSRNIPWIRLVFAALLIIGLPMAGLHAEEAEGDDDGGLFGWVGAMRAKMMAKQYDITDTAAMQLMDILRDENTEKKRINGEIADLMTQLEPLTESDSVTEIAAICEKVKDRKLALTAAENRTIDRVNELIGPQKGARWLLARRGMMQRLGSSVRRANAGSNAAADTAAARPAQTTGYGRSGNAGYR
jgi:Spy/CpxP family protein refolding chaperone